MTIAKALLRAKNVGVRNFRNNASRFIKSRQFFIITERGNPTSVLLPYNDVLEIVDCLEELEDKGTLRTIVEGRRAIKKGTKGILVSKSLRHN